jgi:hypothetical protein
MDDLGLASTLVSLAIFAVALYEAFKVTRIIGRIPRFWFFLLAAIAFVVLRRALVLIGTAFSVSVPAYWATLDSDGTPIIFSALLLLWIHDMRKSFLRSTPARNAGSELPSPEQV